MGNNQPRRKLGALSSRVAVVVGIAATTGIGLAIPAFAQPAPPAGPAKVEGTPCTTAARSCVDLGHQKAWLIGKDGKVIRGPVKITGGGPGKETPPGTFKVLWKDKTHKSNESRLPNGQPAPMPFSVFFAPGGIAFHGGSLERASAGCIHLDDADAELWYNTLQLKDEVQVHLGGEDSDDGGDGDDNEGDDDRNESSAPARPQAGDGQPKPSAEARAQQSPPSNANQPRPNAQAAPKPNPQPNAQPASAQPKPQAERQPQREPEPTRAPLLGRLTDPKEN